MLARRILRAPFLGNLAQPVMGSGDGLRVCVRWWCGEEFVECRLAPVELLAAEAGESACLKKSRAVIGVAFQVLVERRERLGCLAAARINGAERKVTRLV